MGMEGFCCAPRVQQRIIDMETLSPWVAEMPGILLTVPCKVAHDPVAFLMFSLIVCLSTILTRMIGWTCIRIRLSASQIFNRFPGLSHFVFPWPSERSAIWTQLPRWGKCCLETLSDGCWIPLPNGVFWPCAIHCYSSLCGLLSANEVGRLIFYHAQISSRDAEEMEAKEPATSQSLCNLR